MIRSSRRAGLAQLARPPALTLTVTRHGGHCGFFERLGGETWLERLILRQLGAEATRAGTPVEAEALGENS